MKKRLHMSVIGLLVSALAFTGGSVWAQGDREQEVIRQVYPIAADGVFSLNNVNGSVKIKAWQDKTVEIVATKSGPSKEKMDLVKIEINADPQRIAVETIYPKGERDLNVSVSYEIYTPHSVRLRDVDTVNGSVEIDGMLTEVNAATVNGSVKVLNSAGRVNAETVNGSILVELNQLDPNADMKFETVNGSVKVYLPERAGVEVSADTVNGGVHTDFPLAVQGKIGHKKFSGTLGTGGARLRMSAVNGSVNLYRR